MYVIQNQKLSVNVYVGYPNTKQLMRVKVKVKKSRYRPGVAQRVSGS
jgi:hypothetical protein